jgi:NADH-quinone oxidoreductase subunit G
LAGGERKAILLGNAAAHHAQAESLLTVANWIGMQTGASVGYLTEAANTVGAQWVGAQPQKGGANAAQMLAGGLKAVLLLNNEPVFDSAAGRAAADALGKAQMVVTLSPFKANLEFSDVLLPIAPFSETPGTFVNAEGRVQSFHAVVKPQGEARPAWKVLRVLANLLGLPGFAYESTADVLAAAGVSGSMPAVKLNNGAVANAASVAQAEPVVASIYQLDSIVRRAPSLQLTADARRAPEVATREEALA